MSLATDTARLAVDVELLHDIIHGEIGTVVATEGGSVPSASTAIYELRGVTIKGTWAPLTVYEMKDLVSVSDVLYVTPTGHTSGVDFATDLTAQKWVVYQDPTLGKRVTSYSSFAAAITALNGTGATLMYGEDITLAANLTTDVELVPLNGAVINHSAYTISYSGSTARWPMAQVFNGTGAVTGIRDAYAAYWGFSTAASAAVNAAAIQAAIVNYGTGGGEVKLHQGSFAVAPDVISTFHRHGILISGVSSGYGYVASYSGTRLVFTAGTIGINMFDDDGLGSGGTLGTLSFDNSVKNLLIDGADVLTTGIKANGNQIIEDVGATRCRDHGFYLGNMTNSMVLNRVSGTANTAGLGYGLFVDGPLTTVYKIYNSNFRLNKKGINIQAGSGVTLDHIVSESNTEEALKIYKPDAATPMFHFTINHFWAENSWYGNGTGGFGVSVGSYSNADPPAYFKFNTLNINATTDGKHLEVAVASDFDFYNTDMLAGDTVNGLSLNTSYASRVYFHGGQPLQQTAGGTYGYLGNFVVKGASSSPFAGYESTAGYSAKDLRVFRYGDGGGVTRKVAYAAVDVTAAATITIPVAVPAGARLIGAQIRVDTALNTGETWNSAYSGGATANIAIGGLGVTKNVKAQGFFEYQSATSVTTDVTNIAITRSAGGNFTAQGRLSAWVYYEVMDAVVDAP